MQKQLLYLLFAVCSLQSNAQDFTGTWEGEFYTDMIPSLGRRTFFIHIELKQHGNRINGIFYNAPLDFRDKPTVVIRVSGKLNKQGQLLFRLISDGALADYTAGNVSSVFNDFHVRYFRNDTMEVLLGPWHPNGVASPRPDGAGGFFKVRKQTNTISSAGREIFYEPPKQKLTAPVDSVKAPLKTYAERKNNIVEKVISPVKDVELTLYDNGIIDGDIVSVYVNDSLVLENKKLGYKPIKMSLQLEKGKIYKLTLFAENLGSIPPNTAYLFIQFNSKQGKDLHLSCDEENNVSVLLQLKDD
jgi:hypothetical protein